MNPSPRVDQAHTPSDSQTPELYGIGQGSSARWQLALVCGTLLTAFLGIGWYVLGNAGSKSDMAVVFQGRTFDRAGRRTALQHLIREGVPAVENSRGELLVPPARLAESQVSLEKAGLKPETLAEVRNASGGTLSILESPDQREQRRRQTKEKELAWLIRRMDEIGDAHVSLEPVSSGTRWIGRKDAARHRVRVFVEPEAIEKGLTENAVDRIERLILASLPNATPGQITIHDDRRIYRMAEQVQNGKSTPEARSDSNEERDLASKIRESIPELSAFSVFVTLKQVEESPKAGEPAAGASATNTTRLYFNRPVAIEAENSKEAGASVRTRRARIRIVPSPEGASEVASAEKRLEVRKRISATLAPVLVEQVEWLAPPTAQELAAKGDSEKDREISSEKVKPQDIAKAEAAALPLTPIDESQRSEIVPWILGGVVLAIVLGGVFLRRVIRNGSPDSDSAYVSVDETAAWARNLAAAVSDQPVRHGPHELPADKAAEVLSSWLGSVEAQERDSA